MASPGIVEAFMLLLSLGAMPMGMPSAAEDARIFAAAPEPAVAYIAWNGMATADKNSKNKTEQLLAEPQVKAMIDRVIAQIEAAIDRETRNNPKESMVVKEVTTVVKIALSHPGSVYLGRLQFAQGLDIQAGVIVNAGEQANELKASLSAIEGAFIQEERNFQAADVTVGNAALRQLTGPPEMPPVIWGLVGKYMIFAIGQGEADRLVAKLSEAGEARVPAWLTEVRQKCPVERPSSLTYINAKSLVAMAGMAGPADRIQGVLSAMGLANTGWIASVNGFQGEGMTNRTFIQMDGEPEGFMSVFGGKGLSADEVAAIPADSTLAMGARFDAAAFYKQLPGIVGKIDPAAAEEFARVMTAGGNELGVPVDELLDCLGDVVCVYNSPGDGGLLFTGATAVVKLKDPAKAREVHQKLYQAMPKEPEPAADHRPSRGAFVRDFDFAGKTIYFLNSRGEEMPVAPAWCLTDKELIISLYPQMIKSYLSRPQGGNFGKSPLAQRLWASGRAPVMFAAVDTPAIAKDAYGLVPGLAAVICGELQRERFDIDISMLPSAEAIIPHLISDTVAVYRAEGGILFESQGTLPLFGPVPLLVPALGTAGARFAAPPRAMPQPMQPVPGGRPDPQPGDL